MSVFVSSLESSMKKIGYKSMEAIGGDGDKGGMVGP